MTPDDGVTRALDRLALALPALPGLPAAAERLAADLLALVPGSTGAAVLLEHASLPRVAATAGDPAPGAPISVSLGPVDEPLGALTVWGPPEVLDAARADVDDLARGAGAFVRAAAAYFESRALAADLKVAMASRAVIEQAKGVVMAQNRCDPEAAFDLLVRASMRENIKVRDLAARLVATISEG